MFTVRLCYFASVILCLVVLFDYISQQFILVYKVVVVCVLYFFEICIWVQSSENAYVDAYACGLGKVFLLVCAHVCVCVCLFQVTIFNSLCVRARARVYINRVFEK